MTQRPVTVQIVLPAALKQFADRQVARGGLGSLSDYLQALVERDQEAAARQAHEQQLLEQLREGESEPLTAADWQKLREELAKRFGKRR